MCKISKRTKIFLVIAIFFWSVLAVTAFQKYYMNGYISNEDVRMISGTIISCEEWSSNGFYYFSIKNNPNMKFRISYVDKISFEKLEELKNDSTKVYFQVYEKEFQENKEIGNIEVISLKTDKEIFWNVGEYSLTQKKGYFTLMCISITMAIGIILASFCLVKLKR